MATTHPVTMSNFEEIVEKHELVVLDFWAEWCQPCKLLGPVFEELAAHNTDIFFGKVNTEQSQDLAQAFQVRSIPTLMAFKKGELVFEKSGLPPPQVLQELLEHLRTLELEPASAEEET
jgi:thioredoxin